MKVLIVGVTGAIGQLLAKELVARGHRVSGLDMGSDDAWPEGVRRWQGDLRRSITQEGGPRGASRHRRTPGHGLALW